MVSYLPNTYGERIASISDELNAAFDPATITALSQLARGGLAAHRRRSASGNLMARLAVCNYGTAGVTGRAAFFQRRAASTNRSTSTGNRTSQKLLCKHIWSPMQFSACSRT